MRAILSATLAALLFGLSTPASRLLLDAIPAQQLAGLLYLGAALGVLPLVFRTRKTAPLRRLDRASALRLAGAVCLGGILAPLALLAALRVADASAVSLLLTLELAATALLGTLFFHESLGRRGQLGVAGVVLVSMLVSVGGGRPGLVAGGLAGLACLGWALDNQLTSLVDGVSPATTTLVKGLVAGTFNLGAGLAFVPWQTDAISAASALAVGALAYGVSLALLIGASQELGAIRSQAIFAAAPFAGALASLALPGEGATTGGALAALGLGASVALLLTDRHGHAHRHEAVEHVHAHRHDDGHHDHAHPGIAPATRHVHWHRHEERDHSHPHVSDLHHRHDH